MKRIIYLLLFSLIFSVYSYAGSDEKKYQKLSEKFDVPEEAKKSNKIASDYWNILLDNNDKIYDFIKQINKMKGAEKEAIQKAVDYTFSGKEPNEIKELQGFCDTLLIDMGITSLNCQINCSLHAVYDESVNAYTVLAPGGFSIYLTSGLLSKSEFNRDVIMAAVAHEVAHGLYFHHLQRYYAEAKKRRENQLMAGIAAAGGIFSSTYSEERAVTEEEKAKAKKQSAQVDQDIKNLAVFVKTETAKYAIMFGSEQEYEADIVAFRFMDWIGKGDSFIELLYMLDGDYDYYSDYNDHPSKSSRIGLINYLKTHPEVKNKEIEKLRKKNKKGKDNNYNYKFYNF